ncbi:hypothetical protein ACFL3S_13175, partial [Gemmatimonadota bacterium]
MFTRAIGTTALLLALALMPARASGQIVTASSVSLNLGLFDGFGVGLAVSHWDAGSIYSPSFHLGLGVGAGVGFGVHVGSYAPYRRAWDPFRAHRPRYTSAYSCWGCWDPW